MQDFEKGEVGWICASAFGGLVGSALFGGLYFILDPWFVWAALPGAAALALVAGWFAVNPMPSQIKADLREAHVYARWIHVGIIEQAPLMASFLAVTFVGIPTGMLVEHQFGASGIWLVCIAIIAVIAYAIAWSALHKRIGAGMAGATGMLIATIITGPNGNLWIYALFCTYGAFFAAMVAGWRILYKFHKRTKAH